MEAVFGRTLSAGEIRRINYAESIVALYKSRAASDNWVSWASQNMHASILLDAEKLASEDSNE